MIQLSNTNTVSESTRSVVETKHIMPINETLLRLHVPLSVTIDDSDDVSLETLLLLHLRLKANRLCPTSKQCTGCVEIIRCNCTDGVFNQRRTTYPPHLIWEFAT